jgi:hypothetical protein
MTPYNYNPATWNWGYIATEAATFGLKLLGAVVIFVIGWFIAEFIAKAIDKILVKIGFDRVIETGGIKSAMANSGYDPARLISQGIFYTLMIFVTAFALNVFGPNPISDIFSRFIAFFPNILVAIAILILAAFAGAIVRDIVRGSIGRLSYGRAIATTANVAIVMMGVFMALTQLNIAPAIVVGLWYAMLALAVGVGIVAIGGGGIKPMEERWRTMLDRADEEAPRIVNQINGVPETPQVTFREPTHGNANQGYTNQPGVIYPTNPNDPRSRP